MSFKIIISCMASIIWLFTTTTQEQYYSYCPVGIMEESESIFYCRNGESGIIQDYIYLYNADTGYDGIILSPSDDGWDSTHVCDPSVIEGKFLYNNTYYKYVMAYLGCDNELSINNKIGLAFSNSLEGEWIKYDKPIIEGDYNSWGVGQPCLISKNSAGNILLFYTSGTKTLTNTKCVELDLSDIDNIVISDPITVSSKGTNDFLSNGDFTYSNGQLFVCCDSHPFKKGILGFISDKETIYSCNWDINDTNSLSTIKWNKLYTVDKNTTGYTKNHNAGFIRNRYGYGDASNLLITVANEYNNFTDSLFSYKILKYVYN